MREQLVAVAVVAQRRPLEDVGDDLVPPSAAARITSSIVQGLLHLPYGPDTNVGGALADRTPPPLAVGKQRRQQGREVVHAPGGQGVHAMPRD
jgi:hypothetical protein